MSSWIDKVGAIVDAWYPGELGGVAVAEVLFGDYCPAGRLPITFPETVGQVPLYLQSQANRKGDDYADHSGKPLFPFGYGLSYTTFAYNELGRSRLAGIRADGTSNVTFTVTNTGKVTGDEVVQLYVHDLVASKARPVMELKGFREYLSVRANPSMCGLDVGFDQLCMLDRNMKKVVEPGDFKIMIGSSAGDIRLRGFVKVAEK